MPSNQKVSIVTLGCAKNTADTDNLARLLKARGYEVVADPAQAGSIVVHTCSFIEAAKQESINAILQAGQLKEEGKKKLIVSGCLVQQHGQEIFESMPEVDAFLGTGQLAQVADILDKPRPRFMDRAKPGGFMDPDLDAERRKVSPPVVWRADEPVSPTAYLRLSEGCSHPCSFCVIPRLRGGVQSRTEETILKEVRELAGQGVEEFVIIEQDTGDWGKDFKHDGKNTLAALLRTIAAVPGVRWIRLMYMHPASFSGALLDVFAEQPEKFPYLDMPLQHIDTAMLAQMQRKTDEAGLRALITRIRRRVPALSLRTTFIVGFPGETDDQFARLLAFVREGHFDYLGAFAYSQEEGTPAGRRTDQVPDAVKQDRLSALTAAHYDVAHAKAQKRLGAVETLILETSEDGAVLARSRREAPEIDAVIRLPPSAARQGRFVSATLMAYDAYEFTAQPIAKPLSNPDRFEL